MENQYLAKNGGQVGRLNEYFHRSRVSHCDGESASLKILFKKTKTRRKVKQPSARTTSRCNFPGLVLKQYMIYIFHTLLFSYIIIYAFSVVRLFIYFTANDFFFLISIHCIEYIIFLIEINVDTVDNPYRPTSLVKNELLRYSN